MQPIKTLLLPAAIVLLGLTGPATADPSLVGIWFSPYQPDEPDVMSLIEFRDDGTFREEFRKCQDGDYVGYQMESGTWSVLGDIEHIVADLINGDSARAESEYTIVLLTDTERRIRLDPQGYVFVGHRVGTFEFPACATGA